MSSVNYAEYIFMVLGLETAVCSQSLAVLSAQYNLGVKIFYVAFYQPSMNYFENILQGTQGPQGKNSPLKIGFRSSQYQVCLQTQFLNRLLDNLKGIRIFQNFVLKDDLDEGHEEAEELDERDDGGTEREPQPAANGG